MRLTDPLLLHKAFRARIRALDDALGKEGIPLVLYEGARTPFRQAELYARGPHLAELLDGELPPDGGLTWEHWLGEQIEIWRAMNGRLGSPPPFDIDHRPPLTEGEA